MGFSRQAYWSGVPLPSPKKTLRNEILFCDFPLPAFILLPVDYCWVLTLCCLGLRHWAQHQEYSGEQETQCLLFGKVRLNPGLPHCRQRLYPLSHQGSPLGKINISCKGFPGGSVVKNLPTNPGHSSLILGSGRSPGVGNGNPLQYYCLGKIPWTEEPGQKSHRVTKTQLSEHNTCKTIRAEPNFW